MRRYACWFLPLAFSLVTAMLAAGKTADYREALPGYHFQFPRDHFEHEDFRTEWWYYTGNVTSAAGERFGFELVFFREGQNPGPATSVWSVNDLYLAHAALTDVHGQKFVYDQRLNRAGPGIAGASFDKQRVWNGNWSVGWSGGSQEGAQTLDAITEKFRFHLTLKPEKPFVIQGLDGVSQKAQGEGRASYYVSFPLLAASGTIESGGQKYSVSGRAWMDHEWFTEQLAADEVGWDWFSIQLDNRTELMLFQLRHKDGSVDPYSSGTFIDEQGVAHHLKRSDFSLTPGARRGKYPTEWHITVPSLHVNLNCRAVMQNQELKGDGNGPSYWEGAVNYSGSSPGVGYLEMTGYDRPVKF